MTLEDAREKVKSMYNEITRESDGEEDEALPANAVSRTYMRLTFEWEGTTSRYI